MTQKSGLTFNEKFDTEIEDMKYYLEKEGLKMIQFKFTDGWNFRLSIPQKDWNKLKVE